jgi:hypothetical protein
MPHALRDANASLWAKDRFRCRLRRSQVECSVWTLLVELADVDTEDVLELAATEDQERSRHSLRTLPTERSA